MAAQAMSLGPRDLIGAALVQRARRDDAFRAELMRDPRTVVERELGLSLPRRLRIQVVEEQPDSLLLVLPLSPVIVNERIISQMDLNDREVQGFATKNDPSQDTGYFGLAGSDDIPTD